MLIAAMFLGLFKHMSTFKWYYIIMLLDTHGHCATLPQGSSSRVRSFALVYVTFGPCVSPQSVFVVSRMPSLFLFPCSSQKERTLFFQSHVATQYAPPTASFQDLVFSICE